MKNESYFFSSTIEMKGHEIFGNATVTRNINQNGLQLIKGERINYILPATSKFAKIQLISGNVEYVEHGSFEVDPLDTESIIRGL